MRHRHLDGPEGAALTVAMAASILERGDAPDVRELLRRLRADPYGPDARAAEIAAENVDVQGLPALVRVCLERWRRERRAA
jgi:hypothetical protein